MLDVYKDPGQELDDRGPRERASRAVELKQIKYLSSRFRKVMKNLIVIMSLLILWYQFFDGINTIC